MKTKKESNESIRPLDRRDVGIILSAVLFVINFVLFYFIWLQVFPQVTGILRVVLCWVGAYAMTWVMTYSAKGAARLVLTVIMLAIQYVVFHYRP